MNARRFGLALAVGGLLAVACTGDRQPDPVGPSFSGSSPQIDLSKQILVKIDALFPRPILKPLAIAEFAILAIKQARHETAAARAEMLQFVDWTLKLYGAHRLTGDQSAATQANVRDFINLLYQFVGLTPPNISPGSLSGDGAAVVVGPAGASVVSANKLSGVVIPAGALNQTVLVTIARNPNQEAPLPTSLNQFPPFYSFTTSPEVPQFGQEVVVGICVTDPAPSTLRLAHPAPGHPETVEILPLAPVPFLVCPPPPAGIGSRANAREDLAQTGWRGVRDRILALPFLALAPASLQATTVVNPGGLGGRTGSFSPFGAVDFDSVLVPYQAPGYRYKVTATGSSGGGFEQPSFNDVAAEFSTGNAAFGSGAVPEGQVCPLDATVQTTWPVNTDLLLRKTFVLPGGAGNVRIRVAIDNDIQVFVNGVDVTASAGQETLGEDGFQHHEGCATLDSFVFTVPASAVHTGTNLVAVRARDRGVIGFVDVKVTAQLIN